jgi:hypothetical protein
MKPHKKHKEIIVTDEIKLLLGGHGMHEDLVLSQWILVVCPVGGD